MKVLLIILGVLLLIGFIPVGVRFRYNGDVELKLIIAFLRLKLLPKKPKTRKQLEKDKVKQEKKAAKKAENQKKKQAESLIAKPPAPPKPKKPLGETIEGLLPWAKLGLRFVGEFFHRRLCIRRLKIRAVLAGGDPAKLAENTGKAWEAIGMALPVLERGFRIKKRQIVVYPDFRASKTEVEADAEIRLLIGGLVLMLLRYGFRAVRILLKSKSKKKKQQEEDPEADSGKPSGTSKKLNAKAV